MKGLILGRLAGGETAVKHNWVDVSFHLHLNIIISLNIFYKTYNEAFLLS